MKEQSANKLGIILLDGGILLAVSIALVTLIDRAFSFIEQPKDNPIVTAIEQGKTDGLLKTLADVEKKSGAAGIALADEHGRTALMRAAYANLGNAKALAELDEVRAPMVVTLLERGADINTRDEHGWSPLMWAAWSGLPKVAATLLEKGAEVAPADRQGNTALIIAARRGHGEIVEALLAKGADKSAANREGLNALAAAELGLREHPASSYPARQPGDQRTLAALR